MKLSHIKRFMVVLMKNLILFAFLFSSISFASYEEDMMSKVRELVNSKGINFAINLVMEQGIAEYPKKLNTIDTITGQYYVKSTRTINTNHLLASDWKNQIKKMTGRAESDIDASFPGLMQNHAVFRACSFALNKFYFEHGVKLVNLYAIDTGKVLFSTRVTGEDCNPY